MSKPKPPLRSKVFTHKKYKYYFELSEDLVDLTFDIYVEAPNHQPHDYHATTGSYRDYGNPRPIKYNSNRYYNRKTSTSSSKGFANIDEFIVELHKEAIQAIDDLIEVEKKINLDFHKLAATMAGKD